MTNRFSLLCFVLLLAACGEVPPSAPPIASNRSPLVTGQNDLQYWAYKEDTSFTALAAGTSIPLTSGVGVVDLDTSAFRFWFYGKMVHKAYVMRTGLIVFDVPPSFAFTDNESVHTTNVGPGIAPWWDDMTASAIKYEYCDFPTCSPRTLTFEWEDLQHAGPTGPSRKMQVKLYQYTGSPESNAIRINYEALSSTPTSHVDSATVGLIAGTGSSASTETDCGTAPAAMGDMGVPPAGTYCNEQSHWPTGGVFPNTVYKPAPQIYVRDTSPSTYTDLTGPDVMDVTPDDRDDGYATVSLPFDFSIYGFVYNEARVSVNGVITFGASPSNSYENKSTPSFYGEAIMPWWDDLILPDDMTYPGSIRVATRKLTPMGPINEVVIQWKNFQRYNGDGTRHNMQVHLFSDNGTGTRQYVEVVYGPVSDTSTTDNATIGIADDLDQYSLNPGGAYFASCSPNCGAANWPSRATGDNRVRFRRPTFTDLYDNYFTKTGRNTLHCYSCHYQFRQDSAPLHTAVPASLAQTYTMLSDPFALLDETFQFVDDGMGNPTLVPLTQAEQPACGGVMGVMPNFKDQMAFEVFFKRLNPNAFDPMSDALSPHRSFLTWINPVGTVHSSPGKMPYDCTCSTEKDRTGSMTCKTDYTFEKGRRELLTWWSDGARKN